MRDRDTPKDPAPEAEGAPAGPEGEAGMAAERPKDPAPALSTEGAPELHRRRQNPRLSHPGYHEDITPHPSDLEDTPIWSTANRQSIQLKVPRLGPKHEEPKRVSQLDARALDDILAGKLPGERYRTLDHLGTGGMGQVSLVWDSLLRREVALKVPLDKLKGDRNLLRAFVMEALMTAQLEHPNIISSYDMTVQRGEVGFVMRRLKGERLNQILHRLARGEERVQEAYGRVRLLNIFQQIVSAVAYAHDRHIIHRDIKPANVMVGSYGEIQVIDWGLALLLGPEGSSVGGRGLKGAQVGQPPYMAPEMFFGRDDAIDYRSDIYSLGALLYELLTLEKLHVYRPDEPIEAYMRRCVEEPVIVPSERSPHRKISQGLDEICMRCLQADSAKRYQQASDLLEDVIIELEGSREREYGQRAAERAVELALQRVKAYEGLLADVRELTQQTRMLSFQVKGFHPIETKRTLWELEDRLRERDHDLAVAFHGAEHAFHQAMGYDGGGEIAQEHLLEFYYQRFVREEEDRGGGRDYFAARVRSFGDPRYNARMQGDGSIEIQTDPPAAEVTLLPFESVDRVMRPGPPQLLGAAPVKIDAPIGSYLLSLSAEGREAVLAPVQVGRLEAVRQRIYLPPKGQIADGFVYIPAGPFIRGGDFEATRALREEVVELPAYAISRFPVTAEAYMAFLNDVWSRDPDRARELVPRDNNTGEPSWEGGSEDPYFFPDDDREWHLWDPQFPVMNINWLCATAYAQWLGERLDRPLRLPTGDEWEKAGRGVDGRFFPWGSYWDSGFCKNTMSKSTPARPELVGAYPADRSPYGVQDLAGGVHEWCQDWFSEAEGLRLARGGSWGGPLLACRLASRYYFWQQSGHEALGFRLAYPLTPGG